MAKNKFRKAMFKSYWPPTAIFFLLPNLVITAVAWPLSLLSILQLFVPFSVALFLLGYLLAPVIGPKVQSNKIWAFIMAYVCMFGAVLAYILGTIAPNIGNFDIVIIPFFALCISGIFPALLGGILFIGACENA